MSRALLPLLRTVFVLLLAVPVWPDPPETIDAQIAKLMKDGGPPGLAIGIVENGRVTLLKGYGQKRLGSNDPVHATTLFQIGSTTKAFTSAALALLVEEGKIGWDDRVIDRLPEFQMYDPWVTREFTIRDLLTHHSGLGQGAGDLTFIPRTDISRREIVRALRWLKPATSFRSSYAYNNLLYVVAGQVIERVSGKTWEDFVRSRLLGPAGMAGTFTDEASRTRIADRAQPHARLGPPFRGQGAQSVLDETKGLGPNVAPAGGIVSTAEDMCRWLGVQLAQGRLADGTARLWSEASAWEMWKPVTTVPVSPPQGPLAEAMPRFSAYALGWYVRDYHGARIVWHTGGTLGFLSVVVIIPERNVGFVILLNSEDMPVLRALQFILLDHYLGRPPVDWGMRFGESQEAGIKMALAALSEQRPPALRVPPSLPVAAYAGDYRDAWYGDVAISTAGDKLSINFSHTPGMDGELEPYTGDTFVARWSDASIEPAFVTFVVGPDGQIVQVLLKAVSPVADFSYDYQDLDLRPVGARR